MLLLVLCIGALVFGGILRLSGMYSPLDVIFFLAGGLFGALFLLKKLRQAVWKLIRKPVYIVLGIVLLAMLLTLGFIKWGVTSQPEVDCDYLLLLGCKVRDGEPSPILQDRIDTAYDYLTAHPDTLCIATGGQGDDESITEAQCIFDTLTAMGIDPNRILTEDQATCTSENFTYSLALIEDEQATVGVLSSEFHLFRASLMAKGNGLDAVFISAPTTTTSSRIGFTLREIFAVWKYLLLGE